MEPPEYPIDSGCYFAKASARIVEIRVYLGWEKVKKIVKNLANVCVDVIIPAYNSSDTVIETIESVLAQSHKNLKVIVVDDGSTDDTEAAVMRISDPRVQYIKQKNGGVSVARNHGFAASSSPFVAFLDADDLWMQCKLEKQLELFEAQPDLGLVYGSHTIIDDRGKKVGELHGSVRGMVFDELLTGNKIVGSASMALVRREVLDDVGGWNEDLRAIEDWEMWLRIARKYPVDFVPEPIVAIRVIDSGMQHNYAKMAESHEQTLQVVMGEFELSPKQRLLITRACLLQKCKFYMDAGMTGAARRTLARLIAADPSFMINHRNIEIIGNTLLGPDLLRHLTGTPEKRTGTFKVVKKIKRYLIK